MDRPLIVGNWKMNTTVRDAKELSGGIKSGLVGIEGVATVLCPPFTALWAVREMLRDTGIGLGAQDMHHERRGAYTGEVSPEMLVELCQYVILGHSERRRIFGETDSSVGLKVTAALEAGLRPILCVGETVEERDLGEADEVVLRQVRAGLSGVDAVEGLSVAYEPVWAIGTGKAATPDDAQSMMALIRVLLVDRFGPVASGTPLLYGGSVTGENVVDFLGLPDVDGALVGGASLKPDVFVELVRGASLAAG